MMQFYDNSNPVKQKKIVILSGTICFVILLILYLFMLHRDITSEKERFQYIARNEAEHLISTIDCVMARTNTLKAMINDHDGDTSFFCKISEDVYNSVKDETGITLKNFAIAPNGVVSDVYPLEGNEGLLGFDFLDASKPGNLEAKEAFVQGKTILTNPFELVQGGVGMGGRAPVMVWNGTQEKLWGLVTVTIDFENLIEVLKLDKLLDMGVNYILSYVDRDGSVVEMHSGGITGKDTVKNRFRVRNLTWEFTVSPIKGWVPLWRIVLSIILIMFFSVIAAGFASILMKLQQSNAMLLCLSNTDTITGCLNRRAYEEALSEIGKQAIDDDFVYISADVNGLKKVNDSLGHLSGDELICGAASTLKKSVGTYGDVYRIGGDEFVALLYAEKDELEKIMEKLSNEIKNWKGTTIKNLSISIGCVSQSEFPEGKINTMIKTADERMYADKRAYYKKLEQGN
ncbi:MAG: sensor domain-containing diguanylate cyclase [Treponema sp.]|nr:sensor domain-containing diguanylate cyclase [Treponema sp.]